jgi:S1-C subfamily serine protease
VWLNLAAATYSPSRNARNDIEKLMTPDRIAEAQELVRNWKPRGPSIESAREPTGTSSEGIKLVSTGSGFFVAKGGYLVTNFHVVEGCKLLFTKGASGQRSSFSTIAAEDRISDLALLRTPGSTALSAIFRGGRGPELGETILAAGYPLRGLLASSLNVTTGNISALDGIADDPTRYQISAPVQPGNSGGPLFDHAGYVVGVIVEKLDAVKVANWTGDIPQNVNFAIKGSVVKGFLNAHGIRYSTAPSQTKTGATETSRSASAFTVVVECWK